MKRKLSITTIFLAALLFFVPINSFAEEEAATKAPPSLKVGDYGVDFTLKDGLTLEQKSFSKDIRGSAKVTAVVFMTTTCSACRALMALLHNISEDFDTLKIFAVSVDILGETTIPAYDKEFGFNATYLLDPDFTVPQKYGFIYTPGLVLFDKSGKILYIKGGFLPNKKYELIEAVTSFLK